MNEIYNNFDIPFATYEKEKKKAKELGSPEEVEKLLTRYWKSIENDTHVNFLGDEKIIVSHEELERAKEANGFLFYVPKMYAEANVNHILLVMYDAFPTLASISTHHLDREKGKTYPVMFNERLEDSAKDFGLFITSNTNPIFLNRNIEQLNEQHIPFNLPFYLVASEVNRFYTDSHFDLDSTSSLSTKLDGENLEVRRNSNGQLFLYNSEWSKITNTVVNTRTYLKA